MPPARLTAATTAGAFENANSGTSRPSSSASGVRIFMSGRRRRQELVHLLRHLDRPADLELAGEERLGAVEVAVGELDVVARLHLVGDGRLRHRAALDLDGAVVDL